MRTEQVQRSRRETQEREATPIDFQSLQASEYATLRKLNQLVDRFPATVRRAGTALLSLFILGSEASAGVRFVETTPQSQEEREEEQRRNEQWRDEYRKAASREIEPLRVSPDHVEAVLNAQPDRKKDVDEFQNLVQEFMAAGFRIELQTMIFFQGREKNPELQITEQTFRDFKSALMEGLVSPIGVSITPSPLDGIVQSSVIELEHPSVMRQTDKPMTVSPYHICFQQQEGTPRMIVTNWLTERVLLALDLGPILSQFSLWDENEKSALQRFGITQAIQEAVEQDAGNAIRALEELQREAEKIQPREPAYSFHGTEPHAQIHGIVQRLSDMSFYTISFGRDMDRTNSTGVKIDASFLERSGSLPIDMRGSIDHLYFLTTYEQKMDGDGATESQQFRKATDQYGNMILKIPSVYNDGLQKKQIVTERILVYPPTVFAQEAGMEDTVAPVSIDLSVVGRDLHLTNYFFVPEERPIATITGGAYRVYSSLNHEDTHQQYGKWFELIGAEMKHAEELFGLKAGEAAQQLFIVNSKDPNAHFHPKDPHAIVMRDEILSENGSVPSVGFHETAHLLDAYFGIKDRTALVALHATLSRDFFSAIDEKSWYPGEMGGHSEENSAEFIASFLNTLIDPHWEQKIPQTPQSFQQEYLNAMNVFAHVLDECTQPLEAESEHKAALSSTAPIHTLLKQRVMFLSHG